MNAFHIFYVCHFSDVKCMLELDFAFRIHLLSLCEEFLVCASATECQSIQLNFRPNVCSCGVSEMSESAQVIGTSAGSNVVGEGLMFATGCDGASMKRDTSSTGLIRNNTSTGDQVRSLVNVADAESTDKHSRSSAFHFQTKLQQEFTCTDLGLSSMSERCDELFVGPVKGSQPPCHVSVEFEGKGFFYLLKLFSFMLLCLCTCFDRASMVVQKNKKNGYSVKVSCNIF